MTLQHDIQARLDVLPTQQRQPLLVLLEAIAVQSQEQFSNAEIEQRVENAIRQVLEGPNRED
ncbi:MAG: hypothetical protein LKJ69_01775 [Lactobacillus sp.]|jgi:hypothetical protein|nr:hypothetical protein [Lactobacillus sp.]MCI2032113.1 hypothetical protein [Lactobacillus sp.]